MPKNMASLAQLAEHALRKRMVVGSIPTGGFPANGMRGVCAFVVCPSRPQGAGLGEALRQPAFSCGREIRVRYNT